MVKILNVREVETEKNEEKKTIQQRTRRQPLATDWPTKKMGGEKFCLFSIRYRFVC